MLILQMSLVVEWIRSCLVSELHCHIGPLTVKHILIDCTNHHCSMPKMFETVDSGNVIAFINDINF